MERKGLNNITPDTKLALVQTEKGERGTEERRTYVLKKISNLLNNFSNEIPTQVELDAPLKDGQKDYKLRTEWFAMVIALFDGLASEYLPEEFQGKVQKFLTEYQSKRSFSGTKDAKPEEEIATAKKLLTEAGAYVTKHKYPPVKRLEENHDLVEKPANPIVEKISSGNIEIFDFPEYDGKHLKDVAKIMRTLMASTEFSEKYYFPNNEDFDFLRDHQQIIPVELKNGHYFISFSKKERISSMKTNGKKVFVQANVGNREWDSTHDSILAIKK